MTRETTITLTTPGGHTFVLYGKRPLVEFAADFFNSVPREIKLAARKRAAEARAIAAD